MAKKYSTDYFKEYPQGEKEFRYQYCERIAQIAASEGNQIKYASILESHRKANNIISKGFSRSTERLMLAFKETRKKPGQSVKNYLQVLIDNGRDAGHPISIKTAYTIYHRHYQSTPEIKYKYKPQSRDDIFLQNRMKSPIFREIYAECLAEKGIRACQ